MKASTKETLKGIGKILLVSASAIAIILITTWAIKSPLFDKSDDKPVTKTVYIGQDNEVLDNFSREDAVNSLVSLLKDASKDVKGKERSIDDRLAALEGGADIYDVLTPETIAKIYFEDEFGSDQYNRRVTASTLLVQAKLVQEMNESMDPVIKMYDEAVFFDEKRMNAQVPLDIIIGVSTGYAFDMVYVDKEWQLNPYSIIMSMKLSELIVNSKN